LIVTAIEAGFALALAVPVRAPVALLVATADAFVHDLDVEIEHDIVIAIVIEGVFVVAVTSALDEEVALVIVIFQATRIMKLNKRRSETLLRFCFVCPSVVNCFR
jgi:hypothetical protein